MLANRAARIMLTLNVLVVKKYKVAHNIVILLLLSITFCVFDLKISSSSNRAPILHSCSNSNEEIKSSYTKGIIIQYYNIKTQINIYFDF